MLTKEDYLLNFENMLDTFHIYSFKNWFKGKILAGPIVKKYSIEFSLLYEWHEMPDPLGALRLEYIGCEVEYVLTEMEDTDITMDLVGGIAKSSAASWNPGNRIPPNQLTNPEGEEDFPTKKVWVINLKIPKTLLDKDFSIFS